MNARTLLERVEARYHECSSYRDAGSTTMRADHLGSFHTEYDRASDVLTFAYTWGEGVTLDLQTRGGEIVSVCSEPPEMASRAMNGGGSLPSVVASLAGVTFGAIDTIPRLLAPARPHHGRPQEDATLLATEDVDGTPCSWIHLGGGYAIAVEKVDFRIRRSALFLSDVVSSHGRLHPDDHAPRPLGARAQILTCYDIVEFS